MNKAVLVLALVLTAALGGCLGDNGQGAPKETLLAQDPGGNFILYVSNQSFTISPVDITILIDGKKAVEADFAVKHQHNWIMHTFRMLPGNHKLVAVSKKGSARFEKEFEVKDKHWAVVDYWYDPKQSEKKFSFNMQGTPIQFE